MSDRTYAANRKNDAQTTDGKISLDLICRWENVDSKQSFDLVCKWDKATNSIYQSAKSAGLQSYDFLPDLAVKKPPQSLPEPMVSHKDALEQLSQDDQNFVKDLYDAIRRDDSEEIRKDVSKIGTDKKHFDEIAAGLACQVRRWSGITRMPQRFSFKPAYDGVPELMVTEDGVQTTYRSDGSEPVAQK